jgi:hypothetical protein
LRRVVLGGCEHPQCRSFDSAEVRFAQDDRIVVWGENEKQLQVKQLQVKQLQIPIAQGRLSTPLKCASRRMTGHLWQSPGRNDAGAFEPGGPRLKLLPGLNLRRFPRRGAGCYCCCIPGSPHHIHNLEAARGSDTVDVAAFRLLRPETTCAERILLNQESSCTGLARRRELEKRSIEVNDDSYRCLPRHLAG